MENRDNVVQCETKKNDILFQLFSKIPSHLWVAIVSGIVAGFMTHFYMLTHKLPNWDEINNIRGYGSGAAWGRWFLRYVRPLSGEWSVPSINGVLAIIIVVAASCFVIEALNLKSVTSAILVPVMMVTFPGFASTMTFMFTVNSYAIGILLACLGAFFLRKVRFGWIVALLSFTLCMGIYQSYICLAAGILVAGMCLDSFEKLPIKETLQSGLKYIGTLAASMVGYVLITKTLTTKLDDSHGISQMGQIELLRLPRLIMRCYKRILEFFTYKPYSYVSKELQFINVLVCIIGIVIFIWLIVKIKIYNEKGRLFLLLFLAAMLPLALASIYALAPEMQDAALTILYQYFFIYVFLLALAEKLASVATGKNRIESGVLILATGLLILVGYHNYLITNEAYFRMDIAFQRSTAYYNRIIMSMESLEGYEYGDAVAITGNCYPERYPVASLDIGDERFTEFSGIATENGMLTPGVRRNFVRIYLGIELPEIEQETIDSIVEMQEYKEMPVYPKEGSIRKIDDIWIVKLSEKP